MKLFSLIVSCLLLAACSRPVAENQLLFEDAWVRAMPPGSMMTAGFGRLVNTSREDLEIIAYTSPQFSDVSLHQTVMENGLSRMDEVPALAIPAGSEIELAPGGYHLMLMRPTQELSGAVDIGIETAAGRRFSYQLPVERR